MLYKFSLARYLSLFSAITFFLSTAAYGLDDSSNTSTFIALQRVGKKALFGCQIQNDLAQVVLKKGNKTFVEEKAIQKARRFSARQVTKARRVVSASKKYPQSNLLKLNKLKQRKKLTNVFTNKSSEFCSGEINLPDLVNSLLSITSSKDIAKCEMPHVSGFVNKKQKIVSALNFPEDFKLIDSSSFEVALKTDLLPDAFDEQTEKQGLLFLKLEDAQQWQLYPHVTAGENALLKTSSIAEGFYAGELWPLNLSLQSNFATICAGDKFPFSLVSLNNEDDTPPPPIISAVSPNPLLIEQAGIYEVNIEGANFSSDDTVLYLSLGGKLFLYPVLIKSPALATIQIPITDGQYDILLNNAALNISLHVVNYEKLTEQFSSIASESIVIEAINLNDEEDPAPGDEGGDPSTPTPTPSPTPTPPPPLEVPEDGHVATLQADLTGYPVGFGIVHGTFPIPQGLSSVTDIYENGKSPFGVVDSGGIRLAQTEVVSRYPNGDPAVVEVIARVSIDKSDRLDFPVYLVENNVQPIRPNSPTSLESLVQNSGVQDLPSTVKQLVQPGNIILRTEDVFGNKYERDLTETQYGTPRIHRYGEVELDVETYGTLIPIQGTAIGAPSGALPHMMSAHSYFKILAGEDLIGLDLRVGNISSGKDKTTSQDDVLDKIYFKHLELKVPKDYFLFRDIDDPVVGTPYLEGGYRIYPIVKPQADGSMHVIPWAKHFIRRLTISTSSEVAKQRAQQIVKGKGHAYSIYGFSSTNSEQELLSFFHPKLGYFPQHMTAPRMTHVSKDQMRGYLAGTLATVSTKIETGECHQIWIQPNDAEGYWKCSYPFEMPSYGPFHFAGTEYGGMTSGAEIFLSDSHMDLAAASLEGLRTTLLWHRMRASRQDLLVNRAGEPINGQNWIEHGTCGDYLPVEFHGKFSADLSSCSECDPYGYNVSPQFQNEYVATNSLSPDYELPLLKVHAEDNEHLIRVTRLLMSLIWLANDPLAKLDLQSLANNALIMYGNTPRWCYGSTPKYGAESLTKYKTQVSLRKNTGIEGWGREKAHNLHQLAAAYSVSINDAWRVETKTFFDDLVNNVLQAGQIPCTGITGLKLTKDSEYKYWTIQRFEDAFLKNAYISLLKSVYEGADNSNWLTLREVLDKAHYGILPSPYTWIIDPEGTPQGARYRAIVKDKNTPEQVYCSWDEVPEAAKSYSGGYAYGEFLYPFAEAYTSTEDEQFLEAAYNYLAYKNPGIHSLKEGLEKQKNPYYLAGTMGASIGTLTGDVQAGQYDYIPEE